jgi:thioredoxin reductase
MFTFGYEQRGSETAALLAKDSLASVPHAMMVLQDTAKFARRTIIYCDGNPTLAKELTAALTTEGVDAKVDDRRIVRLSKGPAGTKVVIGFEDGTEGTDDFMVHQPATKPPAWITDQLQLEFDVMGNIKVNGFFHTTSVPGVFAAGDCASPFKIIPNALSMGANAGAGLARELPRRVTGNHVDMMANL